jgi:hypothetical protein
MGRKRPEHGVREHGGCSVQPAPAPCGAPAPPTPPPRSRLARVDEGAVRQRCVGDDEGVPQPGQHLGQLGGRGRRGRALLRGRRRGAARRGWVGRARRGACVARATRGSGARATAGQRGGGAGDGGAAAPAAPAPWPGAVAATRAAPRHAAARPAAPLRRCGSARRGPASVSLTVADAILTSCAPRHSLFSLFRGPARWEQPSRRRGCALCFRQRLRSIRSPPPRERAARAPRSHLPSPNHRLFRGVRGLESMSRPFGPKGPPGQAGWVMKRPRPAPAEQCAAGRRARAGAAPARPPSTTPEDTQATDGGITLPWGRAGSVLPCSGGPRRAGGVGRPRGPGDRAALVGSGGRAVQEGAQAAHGSSPPSVAVQCWGGLLAPPEGGAGSPGSAGAGAGVVGSPGSAGAQTWWGASQRGYSGRGAWPSPARPGGACMQVSRPARDQTGAGAQGQPPWPPRGRGGPSCVEGAVCGVGFIGCVGGGWGGAGRAPGHCLARAGRPLVISLLNGRSLKSLQRLAGMR